MKKRSFLLLLAVLFGITGCLSPETVENKSFEDCDGNIYYLSYPIEPTEGSNYLKGITTFDVTTKTIKFDSGMLISTAVKYLSGSLIFYNWESDFETGTLKTTVIDITVINDKIIPLGENSNIISIEMDKNQLAIQAQDQSKKVVTNLYVTEKYANINNY